MKIQDAINIGSIGIAVLLLLATPSGAVTTIVPGTANPFLAGQPDGATCCQNLGGQPDNAPAQSPVLGFSGVLDGRVFTFSATGGAWFEPGVPASTPDGGSPSFSMSAAIFGISGPLNVNSSGLVGVFIGSGVPSGTAPAQRNDGLSFASISPQLNQIFWIGDGLTGTESGLVQQFIAPVGATRLYLGTADGVEWSNNIGAINLTINEVSQVPLPGALPLFATGLGALGLLGWRRKKKACFPA